MVNPSDLSVIFAALADPTRRAMLARLRGGPRTLRELAEPFDMSAVAVWKHVQVLGRAGLAVRCELNPRPLKTAARYFVRYEQFWTDELNQIERYLHAAIHEDESCRHCHSTPSARRSGSVVSSRRRPRKSSKR